MNCTNKGTVVSNLLHYVADMAAVDIDQYDIHTIADALKHYLRGLPSPVIPPAIYNELVYTAQGKMLQMTGSKPFYDSVNKNLF